MPSTNNYNYDNQTLSGPGTAEHLVRTGMIADPDGVMQPYTSGSITPVDLPSNTQTSTFNKADAPIYMEQTESYRQYLTYGGVWVVEFFKDREAEKNLFVADLTRAGDTVFTEKTTDTFYQVIYSAESSQTMYTARTLDLTALRTAYDEAVELTPELTKLPRKVEGSLSGYFLRHPLEKYEEDELRLHDMKFFTNEPNNYARIYFGGRLTGTDIGFYFDNAGNIRASYDPHYLFKASPLLDDLLAYGTPDQYTVGRYPTGMVQFVIVPSLVKTLIDTYGSEDELARRWNNEKIKYTPDFNMGNYPTFEETLDIKTGNYISSNSIFEFTTDDEKKSQTGA